MLLTIAIIMNFAISAAYAAIGLWIAPKFVLIAPTWGTKIARTAGMVFFITCAFTHFELAGHALTDGVAPPGTPILESGGVGYWFTTWHGMLVHGFQAVAGWTFLIFARRYLKVRIYSTEYHGILGERFAQLEEYEEELHELVEDYRRRGKL